MSKLHYLKLFHEINKPNIEFKDIEKIISQDVSLTYKLLRLINSSYFHFSEEINSILQALVLLGINEIRKWASIFVFKEVKGNKPDELIVNSLLRAKLCEDFATMVGVEDRKSEFYLMGLLSHIDAFFNRSMDEILAKLPLNPNIKLALLGKKNTLRVALDIIKAYEKGDWQVFSSIMKSYDLNESSFFTLYMNSLKWTNQIHQDISSLREKNNTSKSKADEPNQ
jgi:EAL and modified HD-GYP domain-containing signal transduction protein